ncbi:thioredoxin [Methylobacterium sp. Leaf456]|uniref:thioredoxin family protein n=1 Tax=Methylobacterium sp. Leaf456 TaxID=1736382 RepID=UPI0006F67D41|nr:thioredoxin family protein [Methylobacterium sp. Leaf456]KQT53413.1 thioredoxin [Methylobacterium sp. Leaf456]
MIRRTLLALLAAAPLGLAPAQAADFLPYTPEALAAAQKAGKPILVEISAPWCPICKTQKPILAKLGADPRFKDLQVFDVDFDSQKPALRALNARMQSTLIAFKGENEVGRSIGETQPEWIEGLVEKAL